MNKEVITKYNELVGDQSREHYGNKVPEYMLHEEEYEADFFFGVKYYNNGTVRRYVGKPISKDGHILVVGGAGSGKSSCIAIPTLKTWRGTIFAIDIKGELTKEWKKIKGDKRPAKIFNLTKKNQAGADDTEEKFYSYDPFYFLRDSDDDDLVQNAREIAQAIVQIPPNVLEPFWLQAAQHILTATILFVNGHGSCSGDNGNEIKAGFNHVVHLIQTKPLSELIREIGEEGTDDAKMHINQFLDSVDIEDSKMLSGISAELSNKVMVFATDKRIQRAFTHGGDTFGWEDLETHNIFMRIAEDKLGQWDGAITLMFTQLIRTLERRQDTIHDEHENPTFLSEHGDPVPPVLLLLDEFPRLGKVDVIQNAVSTLRSKGVTICLMMQSLAQLDKTYGKESRQIIVDNCQYKAILQVTDPENQKIFSDMVGTIRVATRSVGDSDSQSVGQSNGDNTAIGADSSYSTGASKGISRSVSYNVSTSREPIIHPHEFATLEDIVLMTPGGFCRVFKVPYYWPILEDLSGELKKR